MTMLIDTISGGFSGMSTTAATDDSLVSSNAATKEQAWAQLIDHQLLDWALAPQRLGDGHFIAPSNTSLHRALKLAQVLRNTDFDVPDRIVPNGNAGITFEWEAGSVFHTFDVAENGTIEQTIFKDGAMMYSGIIAK